MGAPLSSMLPTTVPDRGAIALARLAVLARRRELDDRGDQSREHRRADQAETWLGDIYKQANRLDDAAKGRTDTDPRDALIDLVAVISSWYDAMSTPPTQPPGRR